MITPMKDSRIDKIREALEYYAKFQYGFTHYSYDPSYVAREALTLLSEIEKEKS